MSDNPEIDPVLAARLEAIARIEEKLVGEISGLRADVMWKLDEIDDVLRGPGPTSPANDPANHSRR